MPLWNPLDGSMGVSHTPSLPELQGEESLGGRREADLCHGKVLVLESGALGAGSGPATHQMCSLRQVFLPPQGPGLLATEQLAEEITQLSSSSNKCDKTLELHVTIYKAFLRRLTQASPQPSLRVEEIGTQRWQRGSLGAHRADREQNQVWELGFCLQNNLSRLGTRLPLKEGPSVYYNLL